MENKYVLYGTQRRQATFCQSFSEYSFGYGLHSPAKIIKELKELEFNSVLLADKDNLHGAVEFYLSAKKQGITPYIGMTCFIEEFKAKSEFRGTATLIAKNYAGFCEIGKISHFISTIKEDFVDIEKLVDYENIFIVINNASYLEEYLSKYKQVYYNSAGGDNKLSLDAPIDKKVHFSTYITSNKYDFKKVMILQAIHEKKALSFNGDPNKEEFQLLGETDFLAEKRKEGVLLCDYIEEGTDRENENLRKILAECNFELSPKSVQIPKLNDKDPVEQIEERVDNFIANYERIVSPEVKRQYKERIDYELNVLKKTGFCQYFILVADIIDYARKKNILVGPGRGSVVGCLIAYCLGITSVDPIEYNLLFERFMNADRVSPPDIDIDFEGENRDIVINYIKEMYGANHVGSIGTISRMTSRSVFKDVCRVFGVDFKIANKMSSEIMTPQELSREKNNSIQSPLEYFFKKNGQFYEYKKSVKNIEKITEYAISLENTARNIGTHACGIVISDRPLDSIVPLLSNGYGSETTQYKDTVLQEQFGLLKIDCLGLKCLDIIKETCTSVVKSQNLPKEEQAGKINILTKKVLSSPKYSEAVYNILRQGYTLGIFQLEGKWITETVTQFGPQSILDLSIINALSRPGPLKWIPHFICKRKGLGTSKISSEDRYRYQKLVKICNENEGIKNLLLETENVPIYQEQIMKLVSLYAGFSLNEADILRQIVGKKKTSEIPSMRKKFFEKAKEKGRNEGDTATLFDDIIHDFCGYGFNKSHAVAYSFLGFGTALLKVSYPASFFASLINSKGKEILTGTLGDKLSQETKALGVILFNPHYCKAGGKTTAKVLTDPRGINKQVVFLGANIIKGIGEKVSSMLEEHRNTTDIPKSIEKPLNHFKETFFANGKKKTFTDNAISLLIDNGYFKEIDSSGNFVTWNNTTM